MPAKLPYVRLSAFYAFYFSTLGLLLPFWSVYLDDIGYSASRIGVLLGAMLGLKIIAPYVWGQLADHLGHRLPVIRLAAVLAAAALPGRWGWKSLSLQGSAPAWVPVRVRVPVPVPLVLRPCCEPDLAPRVPQVPVA